MKFTNAAYSILPFIFSLAFALPSPQDNNPSGSTPPYNNPDDAELKAVVPLGDNSTLLGESSNDVQVVSRRVVVINQGGQPRGLIPLNPLATLLGTSFRDARKSSKRDGGERALSAKSVTVSLPAKSAVDISIYIKIGIGEQPRGAQYLTWNAIQAVYDLPLFRTVDSYFNDKFVNMIVQVWDTLSNGQERFGAYGIIQTTDFKSQANGGVTPEVFQSSTSPDFDVAASGSTA